IRHSWPARTATAAAAAQARLDDSPFPEQQDDVALDARRQPLATAAISALSSARPNPVWLLVGRTSGCAAPWWRPSACAVATAAAIAPGLSWSALVSTS